MTNTGKYLQVDMGREGSCCYHPDHIDKVREDNPPGNLLRLKHASRGGGAESEPATEAPCSLIKFQRFKNPTADPAQGKVYLPQEVIYIPPVSLENSPGDQREQKQSPAAPLLLVLQKGCWFDPRSWSKMKFIIDSWALHFLSYCLKANFKVVFTALRDVPVQLC